MKKLERLGPILMGVSLGVVFGCVFQSVALGIVFGLMFGTALFVPKRRP